MPAAPSKQFRRKCGPERHSLVLGYSIWVIRAAFL